MPAPAPHGPPRAPTSPPAHAPAYAPPSRPVASAPARKREPAGAVATPTTSTLTPATSPTVPPTRSNLPPTLKSLLVFVGLRLVATYPEATRAAFSRSVSARPSDVCRDRNSALRASRSARVVALLTKSSYCPRSSPVRRKSSPVLAATSGRYCASASSILSLSVRASESGCASAPEREGACGACGTRLNSTSGAGVPASGKAEGGWAGDHSVNGSASVPAFESGGVAVTVRPEPAQSR